MGFYLTKTVERDESCLSMIAWYKVVNKVKKNTNRKLYTLVLICGSIGASALYHLVHCSFCGSSVVSLDAKSPQHKSRKLIVQTIGTSLSAAFINLKAFMAFLRSAHCYLQLPNMKMKIDL